MADYDFVILGAGPGGYTAALRAVQLKARVALIEKETLGGVCLNWGCIPTKALYRSSKIFQTIKEAEAFGLSVSGAAADLGRMVARKNRVVEQLKENVARLLKKGRVDYRTGFGYLKDPQTVHVISPDGAEADLKGRFIIIATGTECAPHPVVQVDNSRVHDVKSILDLEEIPRSLFIVGGGVSGCEFAQIFHALGTEIIMTKRSAAPIKRLDADIEKTLIRTLKKRKYKLLLGDTVESFETETNRVTAGLGSGQSVEAEKALVTVGHLPLSYGFGLEEAGLALDKAGHLLVDEHGRTNIPNIYAIGDVTGLKLLAHFAGHMGLKTVQHALGDKEAAINPEAVPHAVFTDPELAWIGLTEAEAKERHNKVKTGQFLFRALGRTVADGNLDGLVKIVAQGDNDRILGVHIIGPQASSLIGEGALAVSRGLSVHDLAEAIHAHPTYTEAIGEAADDILGLAIHKI